MREAVIACIQLLTPFTPHICHVLWQQLGNSKDVEFCGWPQVDESALVEDEKLIIVQVNGKLRAKITVAADASEEAVKEKALAEHNVQQFTEGANVRKVIYVPGKLVNIVAN